MLARIDGVDDQKQLRGFPLGVLQVFAPIRMRNVPDCPQSHGSLGFVPRESSVEKGSGRVRGTVRPETVSACRHPIVRGGSAWGCSIPAVFSWTRTADCGRPERMLMRSESGERGKKWKSVAK